MLDWCHLLWLGICGLYINSFIVDDGAPIKNDPYKIEGQFIPNSTSLDSIGILFLFLDHPNLKMFNYIGYSIIHCVLTFCNG